MANKLLLSLVIIWAFGLPAAKAIAAERLPSDDDVNGILKVCAVGRIQRLEGDLKGKIELWKRGAEATGKASIEDLGALFETIKPDPQSVELYKVYTKCVQDNIAQYLASKSSMLDSDTVLKIVDVNKYRPYLESRLGPPAYVEDLYLNSVTEVGYRWKDIDLQIFYFNSLSIQYTVTVTNKFYKPKIPNDNRCIGCTVLSKYQGSPHSFVTSSKFFSYIETLYEGSTASGDKEVFIGYTTFGAEYGKNSSVFDKFGVLYRDFHQDGISQSDAKILSEIKNKVYPNFFTVRHDLVPDTLFHDLPLFEDFYSMRALPVD